MATPKKPKDQHLKTGRPTKYEPWMCEAVIEYMRTGHSFTAWSGTIGVARSTLYEWADQFPEFSEALNIAKAMCLARWEDKTLNIADGKGGPGASAVCIFALKNMGGDDWADRQRIEHSGAISLETLVLESMKPDPS